MTTFDYTRTRATAERLLARFGQVGAIRRTASGGDAWNPTQVDTDYACTLVVMDYANRDVDGTLIRQTDRLVYVSTAGLAIVPTIADRIMVEAAPLSIVNVKPLSPAGTVVLYEMQCRA